MMICFFASLCSGTFLNEVSAQGINLTGLEKTWEPEIELRFSDYRKKMEILRKSGFHSIRVPMDLEFFLGRSPKSIQKKFLNLIERIANYAENKDLELIFSNFNHHLTHYNYREKSENISVYWLQVLNTLEYENETFNNLYIEIANEPEIYPHEWEEAYSRIIEKIRSNYADIPIIIGGTNYNSIYELSRMEPLGYRNIIYSFHFYEPFIFTHQGTPWTGAQNATRNIPFPYSDSLHMPALHPDAMGTDGEINYRDYKHIGTDQAIADKLEIIKKWYQCHNAEVWCTEYGVTKNADRLSRLNYLKQVRKVLSDMKIKGFIWEYEGNFGINNFGLN